MIVFLQCNSIEKQGKYHYTQTEDNWKLTIENFKPISPRKRKYPVLLVHGLLANRNYFKVSEEKSLVTALQNDGYDVWLLDLRGRDAAGSPGFWFGKHTYDYNMDDYIVRDADAAIRYVLKETGAEKVNWIGHSMGGIIAYARLGTYNETRIANLVTIASPMMLAPADRTMLTLYKMRGGLVILPVLPVATFSGLGPYVPKTFYNSFLKLVYYPENVDKQVEKKVMIHATNNIAKPEIKQFIQALENNGFYSADGKISYKENLANVKIPVLLFAGRRDQLAESLSVRDAYERLTTKDKTMIIAGKGEGFSEDYGHTDLVFGKRAHAEIFPHILNWLNAKN